MSDDRDDRSDDPLGAPPTPPEPFDPSTQGVRGDSAPARAEPEREPQPPPRRRAVPPGISMDTDTFMAIPAPAPRTTFEPPEFEQKRGADRHLDRLLLGRHGAVADRRPGARDRRRQLLRHQRRDVGLHDRLPGPEPGPQPVRGRRDPGRVRPGLPREARAGGPQARPSGSPRSCST